MAKQKHMDVPRLTQKTTAYALLSRICTLITEEPRRYNQGWWRTVHHQPSSNIPACGTVCCVAGWVDTLINGADWGISGVEENARQALGITEQQARRLFAGDALVNNLRDAKVPIQQGTPAYAALGVRHIRAFQKRHASRLKKKQVRPL